MSHCSIHRARLSRWSIHVISNNRFVFEIIPCINSIEKINSGNNCILQRNSLRNKYLSNRWGNSIRCTCRFLQSIRLSIWMRIWSSFSMVSYVGQKNSSVRRQNRRSSIDWYVISMRSEWFSPRRLIMHSQQLVAIVNERIVLLVWSARHSMSGSFSPIDQVMSSYSISNLWSSCMILEIFFKNMK